MTIEATVEMVTLVSEKAEDILKVELEEAIGRMPSVEKASPVVVRVQAWDEVQEHGRAVEGLK